MHPEAVLNVLQWGQVGQGSPLSLDPKATLRSTPVAHASSAMVYSRQKKHVFWTRGLLLGQEPNG